MLNTIRLNKILPYLALSILLIWFALLGFPYISFDEQYANRYLFAFFYCVSSIVFLFVMNRNRYIERMKWGKSIISLLIIEHFCLILFAQKYMLATVIILTLIGIVAVLLYYSFLHTKKRTIKSKKKKKSLKQATAALVCYFAFFLLIIPSGIGFYVEYIHPYSVISLSVQDETDDNQLQIPGTPTEEIIEGLKAWDEADSDTRINLLYRIAINEAEYLGYKNFAEEIQFSAQEMESFELGGYNDQNREIRINHQYINDKDRSAQEVVYTVIHETRHAYQSYIVRSVDFTLPIVQNAEYFKSARLWKENSEPGNYIQGLLYPEEYREQPLEADANTYAEERISVYFPATE